MTPVEIGFIGIGLLLILLITRFPIAFALIISGLVGCLLLLSPKGALNFVITDIYTQLNTFSFSAIPMFILMGDFAAATGITTKLFDTVYIWIGWIRGGLAIAAVGACALFSAICGSGAATAATIGRVAYPQMKRFNYDDALNTGVIAAAGTLGPLIPPSGAMIVYAILTEQSIVKCLVAGILPGILVALLLGITGYYLCKRNPLLGPPGPKTTWDKKIKALPGLIETIVLFVFCIGGLYLGFFTPTQAGGAGALGALIIGLAHRSLGWKQIWNAADEGMHISCMVLFLLAGSIIFGHFMNLSTIPMNLVGWVKNLDFPPLAILLIFVVFYIIAGCFMDALGLMVIVVPIVAPLIFSLGYDPIWFAVVLCMLGETAAITPPVGVSVFVVKAIAPEVSLNTIFKGIFPFFIAICVAIGIIIAFPIIATFIPSFV